VLNLSCCVVLPSTALSFTCAWYSSMVTLGLLHLLFFQVLNISFNVTEREAQVALRYKTGRRHLFGLVVDTGEYYRGFFHNWLEFLTMTDRTASGLAPIRQANLV
jgi:palmitoyltransferase